MTRSKLPNLAPSVLALVLAGCPLYDHADCSLDRAGCPLGTTCDLRSGLCVHLLRREDAGAPNGPGAVELDDAGAHVAMPQLDGSSDAGPTRDLALDAGL